MNHLQAFQNSEFGEIRVLVIDDDPWFIGKDIATALGYERADNAIRRHVDEEDKLMHRIGASGQNRNMVVINESGLYSLILSSKLPSAKKFKRWVTSEVLTTIRKYGIYATPTTLENIVNDPEFGIRLLKELKREREEKDALAEQVNILKPKASYYDLILQSKSLVPISVIAKDYGMTANQMNRLLHELGVQYKQGHIWLLYAKFQDKGYTQTATYIIDKEAVGTYNRVRTRTSTKWTHKGRKFIYNLLKSKGLVPLIEQEIEFEVIS